MRTEGTIGERAGACVALALLACVLGPPARAHADVRVQLSQLLLNEQQPDLVVLRLNSRGLLISRDRGRSFALTCNAALADDLEPYTTLLDADGRLLFATHDGLLQDDGRACGVSAVPSFAGRWLTDLARDPRDPRVVFAVHTAVDAVPAGLLRRNADGSVEQLGVADSSFIGRLRVVARPDGGLRFWQDILAAPKAPDPETGEVPPAEYALRFSDDEGAHWTVRAVATDGIRVRLEAVDPGDPDRALVSVEHDFGVQLLRSDDAGLSWQPYLSVTTLGGVAFLPDGGVLIGDAGDLNRPAPRGLWRASSLGSPPELVTDAYPVLCLGVRASDQRVLACQPHAFGAVDLADGKFTPWVQLKDVQQLVRCDGIDVRVRCQSSLLGAYCGTVFPCATVCDASGLDSNVLPLFALTQPELAQCLARRSAAPDDAGTSTPPPTEPVPPTAHGAGMASTQPGEGCAVQLPGSGSAAGSLLPWLLAAAALRMRRRGSPRRPQRHSER